MTCNFLQDGFAYNLKQKTTKNVISIFSLVVRVTTDRITAKPYILQRNLYFTDFVQNSLHCNIDTVIFVSEVMEAVRGQKHSSEAKKA